MKFKVEGVEHEFDEERLTFGEGRALEKVTGYAFGEIGEHGRDLGVIQAWVWVALKREEPTLKFSDLDDRAVSDFDFGGDEDEDETPTDGDVAPQTDAPSTSSDSSDSAISLATAPSDLGSSTV